MIKKSTLGFIIALLAIVAHGFFLWILTGYTIGFVASFRGPFTFITSMVNLILVIFGLWMFYELRRKIAIHNAFLLIPIIAIASQVMGILIIGSVYPASILGIGMITISSILLIAFLLIISARMREEGF